MPINFAQRDRGREDVIRQCVAGYEDDADLRTAYYPDHVPTLHNKVSRYNTEEPKYKPKLPLFIGQGSRAGCSKSYLMPRDEWEDVMFYILHNIKEVEDEWMR